MPIILPFINLVRTSSVNISYLELEDYANDTRKLTGLNSFTKTALSFLLKLKQFAHNIIIRY